MIETAPQLTTDRSPRAPRRRRLHLSAAAVAVMLAAASSAAAQRRAVCPPVPRQATDTTVYLPCQLDRAPVPDTANRAPPYPEIMRSASVSGEVRARFVVDTVGRADMRTFRATRSSHEFFTAAVTSALPQWRFTPGELSGRKVRTVLEWEVEFTMPAELAAIQSRGLLIGRDTAPDGVPRIRLGWAARDTRLPPFDAETERAIQAVVLASLVSGVPVDSTGMARIVCVSLLAGTQAGEPDLALLRALTRPRVAVLPTRRCPPTFANMMVHIEPGGGRPKPAPPGEDPYYVGIREITRWASDAALVRATAGQGMSGVRYDCRVVRTGSNWSPACNITASFVH